MEYFYPDRESKSLEFKVQLPSWLALVKTCVAFANGSGGKIIIGVEDETRKIIGVDEAIRHGVYDEFPNSLYDMTSPGLLAEVYEQAFGDKGVMVIEIANSHKKPVFIKKEGMPKGVYLRAGSSTRRANPDYIEELLRENQRIYLDEKALHIETVVLSDTLMLQAFGTLDQQRLVIEKVLVRSATDALKYCPTVTGVLFFSPHPEYYLPEAVIQCTRFRGVEGRDIIQSEEIVGSLAQQIHTSFQLVKSWLMRNHTLSTVKLQGKTLIPEEALREAIINAVIHRKYWLPGAVKIALYDDRLEIFSPGNFPGLMNERHLGDGTTYLRNPHIARIARCLGLVEKLGTGIKLMLDSCHKVGIKAPEFQEGADSVKVIFSFLPIKNSLLTSSDNLLMLFQLRQEVSIKEVEAYLNVSRNTATRKLNQLIEMGKIQRQGHGPAVKYTLINA